MRILFQIAIAVLSIISIVSVMRKKNEQLLGPLGAFFWIIFWVAIIGIVSAPNITQYVADVIGIGRGVDLIMYSAIAILFFVVFKLHIKIEGLKRDLTEVVRIQTLGSSAKNSK